MSAETIVGAARRRLRAAAVFAFLFAGTLPGLTFAVQSPAPTAVAPTDRWQTQFTAHWGANGNPDGTVYELQLALDSAFTSVQLNSIVTTTYTVLADLQPGVTYYTRVLANYSNPNVSSFTVLASTVTPVTGLPGPPPLNPIISSETYNSITVAWDSPGATHGYRVEASTAADFSGALFSGPGSTTTILSGLGIASFTTYYVRVGAIYDAGSTPVLSYALTTPASVQTDSSALVTSLTAYDVGSSSITWEWNPVSGASVYNVYMATSPSTLIASVATSSFTETGLTIDTQYGRVVSAVVSAVEGPLSDATSTYTQAAVPGAPTYSDIAYSSATVLWDASGNPGTIRYELNRSVHADFSSWETYPQYSFSSVFTSTTAAFTDLAPGTSYYFRVHAENSVNTISAYSPVTLLRTLGSIVPQNFTASSVGSSSITWTWDPVVGVSSYSVYLATAPSVWVTGGDINSPTETVSTNLIPNTQYSEYVTAHVSDAESDPSNTVTVYTLAVTPSTPTFTGVRYTSATFSWGAQGNSTATPYQVSVSTVPDFSVGVSTVIPFAANFTGTTTTFFNLSPGTTSYYRVRARNGDGLFTSFSSTAILTTLSGIPVGLTAKVLGASSITWTWSAVPLASSYNLYQATSPATLVAGGISTATFTETNLSTNTLYGRTVTAVLSSTESAASTSVSTYTFASLPLSTAATNVQYAQLTAQWLVNGNPAGTSFALQVSSNVGFTPLLLSTVTTSTGVVVTSLQASTTYYMRVRAVNAANVATAYTILPFTQTLVAPPSSSTLTGVALSANSIQWVWSVGSRASGYRILASSGGAVSGDLSGATTTFIQVGLSTNTAYTNSVQTFNVSGSSTSAAVTRYTWAVPPLPLSPSGILATQMTLNWADNGNPAGTSYVAQVSTDSGFGVVNASSGTTATTLSFSGLQPSTTYFARVAALNFDAIASSFTALPSTVTLIAPPAQPVLQGIALSTSAILWSWSPVTGAAGYRVFSSTGGSLSGDLPSATNIFIQSGLAVNSAYGLSVVVFNISGISTSTTLSRYTQALAPEASALSDVGTSSITLSWEDNGNPAGTTYEIRIWQTQGTTTTLNTTSNVSVFNELASGATYFLNVRALNGDAVPSAADLTLSTVTTAVTNAVATIDPDKAQTVVYNGHDGAIRLSLPAQTFTASTVVTLEEPASYPAVNTAQYKATGVGVEIQLDRPVEPSRLVTLSLPFNEHEVAGLDKSKLVLARYDATQNIWVPYVSRVDALNNTISADVNHFSIYQVVATAVPSVLGQVKIFPNPFRPAQGHTSVTIANLPGHARLRIYTLAGELVKDFSANDAGMASWDGTNQSGQNVASGLYFIFVEGAGDKDLLRVAVQR